MILLSATDITKKFGPDPVLDGATLEVRPGERLALVGPNGAGKSTLLKILAGQEDLDSGRLEVHDSARLAYLEQHPEFSPTETVWDLAQRGVEHLLQIQREAEATAHAMAEATDETAQAKLAARFDRLQHQLELADAYHLDHRIERILHGLGFPDESFQQLAHTLSGGQQNRLLLAKLLLSGAELLLLDEPSNHLDIEATEWLEEFLVNSPQALIVISHDRYFLDRVTTRTLELFNGTIDSYPGNFSDYWNLKGERLKVQQRTFNKQQDEIGKIEEFIVKNTYGQKHQQAKDREKKLARIERVVVPREITAPLMGLPAVERTGDLVLRVERLSKSYDKPLFQQLTWEILRGQRWGVLGPNGSGKTTLLKCIVGHEKADEGAVRPGTGVKIGYYDQLLSGLDENQQVVDAVRPPKVEFNDQQRRDLLARFGLRGDIVFQPVGSLSGGERSRAALAKLSATDANFLILDEPTNHLDLWARDALERSILAYEGTVLFVSHDRYFLNRVADHLLIVEPGRFRVIEGNYETYLHLVSQGLAAEAKAAAPAKKQNTSKPAPVAVEATTDKQKAKKTRQYPYRKVADLEAEIFERESRLAELQTLLVDPATLRDGRKVKEVQTELTSVQYALTRLYAHWEEASELNG